MPEPDKKAYKGWRGTIRAALTHHPEKFSKEACKKKGTGKLCPYAIFTAMKEKGTKDGPAEPHYKEQPHTTKGDPKKKEKFKGEGFAHYIEQRDLMEAKKKRKMLGFLNANTEIP